MCIYPEDVQEELIKNADGSVVVKMSPTVEITGKNGEKIPVFWGKTVNS